MARRGGRDRHPLRPLGAHEGQLPRRPRAKACARAGYRVRLHGADGAFDDRLFAWGSGARCGGGSGRRGSRKVPPRGGGRRVAGHAGEAERASALPAAQPLLLPAVRRDAGRRAAAVPFARICHFRLLQQLQQGHGRDAASMAAALDRCAGRAAALEEPALWE